MKLGTIVPEIATARPVRARIEQAELGEDVALIASKAGDRMAYNPRVIDALDARLALNVGCAYTEGELVDGLRELGRNATHETGRRLYALILGEIDRTGDAPGTMRQVLDVVQQVLAEQLADEAGK
ncbi:hypothetical protein AB0C77_04430 [Streptomyces sp. NPDC048629]|uniref:hypothetical protein n=1 Tax=Streptomyces sp. NPDC048629 TaxID=3154824 RepID=UPI003443C580